MTRISRSPEPESLRDHFLIAMPSLNDGYFGHAVTYICDHDEEGALGLVINQPTEFSLRELLEHVELEPGEDVPEMPVFRGGPVQPEHGFVLHSAEQSWRGSQAITDSIVLTTSRDVLEAINAGKGPGRVLIALGHAGWGSRSAGERTRRERLAHRSRRSRHPVRTVPARNAGAPPPN